MWPVFYTQLYVACIPQFAEKPLVDGLYWETWYNSRNLTEDERGYIYYESKLLGLPRLRQVGALLLPPH